MKDQFKLKLEEIKERATAKAEALAKRIQRGYEFALEHEEPVKPGIYEVVESDFGGMHNEVQFLITVQEEMAYAELFMKLLDQKGYLSGWDYLKIRPHTHKPETFIVK